MISVYIIILFLIACVACKTEKHLLNPVSLFVGLWAVIILLSNLRLYTLYKTSDYVYNYLFLGIVCYVLGFYLTKFTTKKRGFSFRIKHRKNVFALKFNIKYQHCYASCLICILYLLYRVKIIGVSLGSILDHSSIVIAISSTSYDTGVLNAINFLFVQPMLLTMIVIQCIDFYFGERKLKLFVLIVIMGVLRFLTTGGRIVIIQMGIAYLIGLSITLMNKENLKIYTDRIRALSKWQIAIPICLSIILFYFASVSRYGQYVLKTIYSDFAMQPYMFEKWSEVAKQQQWIGYGSVSTFGFIYPVFYVIKNIFGMPMPTFINDIYSNVMSTFSTWLVVGDEIGANAYTSLFFYLYYDARIIGIIVGSILLGIISYNSFAHVCNRPNLKSIAFYIFLSILLIYSFTDLESYKASYILALIYINFILKTKSTITA